MKAKIFLLIEKNRLVEVFIVIDESILRLNLYTIRPKSPSYAVILTHILCTKQAKFLIDDDMITNLHSTQIRNDIIVYQKLFLYCAKNLRKKRSEAEFLVLYYGIYEMKVFLFGLLLLRDIIIYMKCKFFVVLSWPALRQNNSALCTERNRKCIIDFPFNKFHLQEVKFNLILLLMKYSISHLKK